MATIRLDEHCIFIASNVSGSQRDSLRKRLFEEGLSISSSLDVVCTAVLATSAEFDEIHKARLQNIPVVRPAWILDSIDAKKTKETLPYSVDSNFLDGLIVCTSQITSDLRQWSEWIQSHGGKFTQSLTHMNTHLVLLVAEGKKYEAAVSAGFIWVVTQEWLKKCKENGYRYPEKPFAVSALPHPRPSIFDHSARSYSSSPQAASVLSGSPARSATASQQHQPSSNLSSQLDVVTAALSPSAKSGSRKSDFLDDAPRIEPKGPLSGYTFCIDGGYGEELVEQFANTIESIGGRVHHLDDMHDDDDGDHDYEILSRDSVTHILTRCQGGKLYDIFMNGQKKRKEVIAVTGHWLDDVQTLRRYIDPRKRALYTPLPSLDGIEACRGLRITVSGFMEPARSCLKSMINAAGGAYTGTMAKTHTHLICLLPSGEKWAKAKAWNVSIVNPKWLEDCLTRWTRLPEHDYKDISDHYLEEIWEPEFASMARSGLNTSAAAAVAQQQSQSNAFTIAVTQQVQQVSSAAVEVTMVEDKRIEVIDAPLLSCPPLPLPSPPPPSKRSKHTKEQTAGLSDIPPSPELSMKKKTPTAKKKSINAKSSSKKRGRKDEDDDEESEKEHHVEEAQEVEEDSDEVQEIEKPKEKKRPMSKQRDEEVNEEAQEEKKEEPAMAKVEVSKSAKQAQIEISDAEEDVPEIEIQDVAADAEQVNAKEKQEAAAAVAVSGKQSAKKSSTKAESIPEPVPPASKRGRKQSPSDASAEASPVAAPSSALVAASSAASPTSSSRHAASSSSSSSSHSQSKLFIIGGEDDEKKLAALQSQIIKLKGKHLPVAHSYSNECTHYVVVGPPKRTEKWMAACAGGKWIVNSDFIADSAKAKKWKDEEEYEFAEDKVIPISEGKNLWLGAPAHFRKMWQNEQRRPYDGLKIAVLTNDSNHKAIKPIFSVLEAGGSQVLTWSKKVAASLNFALVPEKPELANSKHVQEAIKSNVKCLIANYVFEMLCRKVPPSENDFLYH